VTQRSVEMVIGRLVTDEDFRVRFRPDPHQALGDLLQAGMHLTLGEIAALVAMDARLWARLAAEMDPRLQKASWRS